MSADNTPPPISTETRREFAALLTRMWDNELTELDAVALGSLLTRFPELRQEYLEAKLSMEDLVELCQATAPQVLGGRSELSEEGDKRTTKGRATRLRKTDTFRPGAAGGNHLAWVIAGVASLAAIVMIAAFPDPATTPAGVAALPAQHPIAAGSAELRPLRDEVVATVVDAVSTDVVDHLQATIGHGLTVGRVIEVDSGVTELRFNSGANAILAGPARMVIVGPKQVRLDVGSLSVQMDEGIEGFEVITPDGRVTDLGTAFGVKVSSADSSEVAVFDGEVELQSTRKAEGPVRLLAGEAANFGTDRFRISPTYAGDLGRLSSVSLHRPDMVLTPTKDAYVRGYDVAHMYHHHNYGSERELLVKYETAAPQSNRRAWIQFDLSDVPRDQLIGARLSLTILPNHLAEQYAQSKNREYSVTDANWVFEVAGLWDEFYDDWQEDRITWANAPGNSPTRFSGFLGGARAPQPLGTFTVHSAGEKGQQVVIAGSRLLDFLREDADGKVTLIISRRTPNVYNSGEDVVVHGFASREHEELSPPTLELWGDIQPQPE